MLTAAAGTTASNNGRFGHATDEAIRQAAGGGEPEARDAYLPFQSGRPFAASLTGTRLTIKGAPEVLASALDADAAELNDVVAELAAKGLRVIAVAERTLTARQAARAAADPLAMERLCRANLTPVGLLGLADTRGRAPRNCWPSWRAAVSACG